MSLIDAPVVARVVRNQTVESVHRGIGAITAPDGSVLDAVGDPQTPFMARSANKPLQALAMLRAGLDVPPAQLAIACASHSGEAMHLETVRSLLADFDLTEADLQNTPALPLGTAARDAWLADGNQAQSLTQNCSGKHAAMVATCVARGWDIDTYRDPEHPLQQLISQTISEAYQEPIEAMGIDGCGAPLHVLPIVGLARAFGALASAQPNGDLQARDRFRIATAMRTHPELVGGTDREDTVVMQRLDGAIAKMGAEGVLAVGLPDGRGVVVKIVDGAARAANVFLGALLRRAGVDDAATAHLFESPVLGHGQPVGAVEPAL